MELGICESSLCICGFVSLLSMLVISRLLLVVVVGSGASEHFGKDARHGLSLSAPARNAFMGPSPRYSGHSDPDLISGL